MSPSLSLCRSLLLAVALVITSSCTARDLGSTSVVPEGAADPTLSSNVVTGQLINVAGDMPAVTIQVFLDGTKLQDQFTTTSEESGRYSIAGIPAGNYRFTFTPPTPDPDDPTTNIREVHIGDIDVTSADLELPVALFAPVVDGGMLISSGNVSDQVYQILEDPTDLGSAVVPGFESMSFEVRANAQVRFFGFTLTQLGIDDNTSNTGRDLLVEVAIIRADQLPGAHIDEDGASRTSQVYYALYPGGFDFVFNNNVSNELEVDFPNVNGLSNVFIGPQIAFSHLTRTWESAGILDVNFDGVQAVTVNFDGVLQTGIIVAPGLPTPTTTVIGQIMNGVNPLTRAGIKVLTNSGFSALTDDQGMYRIEDVPIPLNCTDLIATAYADRGLIFASGSSSARPTYPTTTIDIDLPVVVLTAPSCDLGNSEPAAGSVGIETNERIRLRFTGDMSSSSLESAITVTATDDLDVVTAITGKVVSSRIDVGGGELHTDAFFIPDVPLPINSTIAIAVADSAENKDGMALDAACSFNYRTGTSTLFNPRIDVMEPTSGPVGTVVTLHGINLDIASLTFDSQTLAADTKSTTEFTFTIQTAKGTEAPGSRVVQLDPGAVLDAFVILPRIDSVQIDIDPDTMVEDLVDVASGEPGTLLAGADQNDGTLLIINGQNLFDSGSGLTPVVSFGFGNGDAATQTDGDAAIDGPDETAAELRVDVNVPPMATTGELTVIVDDGSGNTFTSPPVTFIVELPPDLTAPVVDTLTLDPAANSNGNPTNSTIRVEYDEAMAANSRILVGAGAPLRILPGTTVSTTSLDGKMGILEFTPESGSLPASSTIQVQLANTTVFDLAGNPSNNLTYFFSTGSTEPGGGVPPSGGDFRDGLSAPLNISAADSNDSDPSGDEQTQSPSSLVRILELDSRLDAELGTTSSFADAPLLANEQAPFFLANPASFSDWSGQQPIASWNAEQAQRITEVEAFYAAHYGGSKADGSAEITTLIRFDLNGEAPNPSRQGFRFQILLPETDQQLTGLITDFNENGKFELSLFSESIGQVRVLAREDLIQVGDDFIEFQIPAHAPLSSEGSAYVNAQIRIESFDLLSASYSSSPIIQFRSN